MKTQLSVCLMVGARAKKKVGFKLLSVGLLRKASPCQPKCGASPCPLLTVLSVCSFIIFVLMMVLTLNVQQKAFFLLFGFVLLWKKCEFFLAIVQGKPMQI